MIAQLPSRWWYADINNRHIEAITHCLLLLTNRSETGNLSRRLSGFVFRSMCPRGCWPSMHHARLLFAVQFFTSITLSQSPKNQTCHGATNIQIQILNGSECQSQWSSLTASEVKPAPMSVVLQDFGFVGRGAPVWHPGKTWDQCLNHPACFPINSLRSTWRKCSGLHGQVLPLVKKCLSNLDSVSGWATLAQLLPTEGESVS